MVPQWLVDCAKDGCIATGAISVAFFSQSWQAIASDVAVGGAAVLVVLRIAYLLWRWFTGRHE